MYIENVTESRDGGDGRKGRRERDKIRSDEAKEC